MMYGVAGLVRRQTIATIKLGAGVSIKCNEPVFAMTNKQPSTVLLRALLLSSALALTSGLPAMAQSSPDVRVDLSAIDGTPPPSSSGRIVLRPPSGTSSVSNSGQKIKLRPPTSAPKMAAKPAAPVAAKPTAAAEPAAPAPAPEAAPTPPPVTTPVAATPPPTPAAAPVTPKPAAPVVATPAPAAPIATPAPVAAAPAAPTATTTPNAPSAAAVKSAQQDPAGPAAFVLPDKQQSAAATPTQTPASTNAEEVTAALTIPFAAGLTDIDVSSQGIVKDLAGRMTSDKTLRVQLMAYATDPEKNTSKARRLALDRAIGIRNMLIEGGVERTRIEVRALGDQGEGGNLDRVDAVAVKR